MGPFPHHAAKSQISAENPAGTDGLNSLNSRILTPMSCGICLPKWGIAYGNAQNPTD